jgi:hypothetical protein
MLQFVVREPLFLTIFATTERFECPETRFKTVIWRLIASGFTTAEAEVIYRAARSAIVRCPQGRGGPCDVPAEQFKTRRVLELSVDPFEMVLFWYASLEIWFVSDESV